MTISDYANRVALDGFPLGGRGARARYRAEKRADAQERQARYDVDVARVAGEQNVTVGEARRVVRARRRHEHRAGGR